MSIIARLTRKQGPLGTLTGSLVRTGVIVFEYVYGGITYYVAFSPLPNPTLVDYDPNPGQVINNALGHSNTYALGDVTCVGATYPLEISVSFPGNALVLTGLGRGTIFNGDALATNVHAIIISGYTDCVVKDLAVETEEGSGKNCDCIFIEDGANNFRIEYVQFLHSAHDCIHIEGTNIEDGWIVANWCPRAAIDFHCVYVDMDQGNYVDNLNIHLNIFKEPSENAEAAIYVQDLRDSSISENKLRINGSGCRGIYIRFSTILTVNDNIIHESGQEAGSGAIQLDTITYSDFVSNKIYTAPDNGIYMYDCDYNTFISNTIWNCDFDGIYMLNGCTLNTIDNNIITSCRYGINIGANAPNPNVGNIVTHENYLLGNTTGCILDAGTNTKLPEITAYVTDPDGHIGYHPALVLTDGVLVTVRFEIHIPSHFQELVRARAVVVPDGTGNMNRSVDTEWGEICVDETYHGTTLTLPSGQVAVGMSLLECIDITNAFTGIGPSDDVGVEFTRDGSAGADTVNADCYLLKINLQYV